MPSSLYTNTSRTAARALEQFSDKFKEAFTLGEITQWAEMLGLVENTDALRLTYPLPVEAAGYAEFKNDMRYRSLYLREINMKLKIWQDGVEALARQVEAPDFVNWAGAPASMALEALRLPNTIVAEMLALSSFAGPLLDLYRDPDTNAASTRRLFASDHPYNVFDSTIGTFDNRMDTTVEEILDGTLVKELNAHFRSIKGPNGKPLGLRMSGGKILAPGARENTILEFLNRGTVTKKTTNVAGTENVAATEVQNIWTQGIQAVIGDELASDDYLYAFAAGRPGLAPWIVQKGRVEEFRHDKDSEKYKSTLKVGVSEVLELNAGAAMPQAIVRIHVVG